MILIYSIIFLFAATLTFTFTFTFICHCFVSLCNLILEIMQQLQRHLTNLTSASKVFTISRPHIIEITEYIRIILINCVDAIKESEYYKST